MNLKLKNIGIIKKADINIDGLTVIAGENDSGKSTVGKVLYAIMKSISKDKKISTISLKNNFNQYFDGEVSNNGNILFTQDNIKLKIEIDNNNYKINEKELETCFFIVNNGSSNVIMIETPLVWNMMELFTKLPMIEDEMAIELEYPKIMKDLHLNLSLKSKYKGIDISDTIKDIINGEFLKDDSSNYYFNKDDKKIKLINTATGIKYFGILQTLSNNNHLNQDKILILDEPEVHLHPKWQLKLAELIVILVKNGVKIVVNSHSPYMIEALQRYSEQQKIEDQTNFYLAQDEIIDKIENSNSRTLSEIFEKLSEPFDIFDEMDSNKIQND